MDGSNQLCWQSNLISHHKIESLIPNLLTAKCLHKIADEILYEHSSLVLLLINASKTIMTVIVLVSNSNIDSIV